MTADKPTEDWLAGDEWLTIPQAIQYAKISRTKIYEYMRNQSLKYYLLKDTDSRRVRKSDLDALMIPPDSDIASPHSIDTQESKD